MKDNRPPKHLRTLKRGDTREDGMIFWAYAIGPKDGELWKTEESFNTANRKKRAWNRKSRGWPSEMCNLPNGTTLRKKSCATPVLKAIKHTTKMAIASQLVFGLRDLESAIGLSREEFITHIESQFQEGMTWENYGEWHIDHIKPLSSFNLLDKDQVLEANHYTNLQPLWAAENLKKSNKML